MKLFICEKPSQGRDVARNLGCQHRGEGFISGDGVTVTWCIGHLLQQQPPEHYKPDVKPWRRATLPVVPDVWKMQVNEKTGKQFRVVESLLKTADSVVIATDADREGDVIGRELLDHCHFKGNVERLWLTALDDTSIKKALRSIRPGTSTENLYQAGLGRQRADWLIGMNMTMGTTSYFSKGTGVLSVGRVQTPTLQLVVNRDLSIEKFTSEDYYELLATFKTPSSPAFVTTWQLPKDDEVTRCTKRSKIAMIAEKIQGATGEITEFSDNPKHQSAPTCLSLSTLQKIASSQFGIGAKKTLEVAQSLYETHKVTTYPRTDCGYLPLSQFTDAPVILKAIGQANPTLADSIALCDTRYQSSTWNDKKITAHHGIIPTTKATINTSTMSEDERNLYSVICRYYIAQFLGDYEYAQRKVMVTCEAELFVATANTPTRQGWKAVLGKFSDEKKAQDETGAIPELGQGDATQTLDTQVLTKKTKPPARYTEGTLIQAMKNVAKDIDDKALKKILKDTAGIGTEATRANIIDLLLRREFLVKDKKFVISTKKGRSLLEKVPEVVKNPATTAQWEQMLDEVACGTVPLSDFLQAQCTVLHTMFDCLDKIYATQPKGDVDSEHQCPDCKSALARRKGSNGFFWGCTAYPNCSTTMPDKNGKPAPRKPQIISHHDCPTCKANKLAKRQGRKKPFWGCTGYPDCTAIFWDKGNKPDFDNLPKAKGKA